MYSPEKEMLRNWITLKRMCDAWIGASNASIRSEEEQTSDTDTSDTESVDEDSGVSEDALPIIHRRR